MWFTLNLNPYAEAPHISCKVEFRLLFNFDFKLPFLPIAFETQFAPAFRLIQSIDELQSCYRLASMCHTLSEHWALIAFSRRLPRWLAVGVRDAALLFHIGRQFHCQESNKFHSSRTISDERKPRTPWFQSVHRDMARCRQQWKNWAKSTLKEHIVRQGPLSKKVHCG